MQITAHFSLDEFTASDTADRLEIDNEPTPEHLANLRDVTLPGFEQIRMLFGRAVVISSGYRNPRLNAAVHGVPTSAHALGYAGDCHVAAWSDFAAASFIRDNAGVILNGRPLRWDQLIYEKGRCVHISFDPRLRGQVLSQPDGPGGRVLQGIVP